MIKIKSQKEIDVMREGGKLLAKIMSELSENIIPGKNTLELDKLAEKLVFAHGGTPSFKNYGADMGNPFPATICASINSEIVHGIPKSFRILKNGDILKIDIGMEYKGFHTDMARTFPIGKIDEKAKRLVEVTEKSFWEGIKNLSEGSFLSEYSKNVQNFAEKKGFSVVKNLVGHGIGRKLHEDPSIPNYFSRKYEDFHLFSGMTLALEPMINEGSFDTILDDDGWTFKTKDGKLSAHYENTVLITKSGVEVLTK